MDIKKIQEIVNSAHASDENKRKGIINVIAMDKKAMPDILEILGREREQRQELISDMNAELSRAHVFIDQLNPAMLPKKEKQTEMNENFTQNFVRDRIAAFYIKYKGHIQYLYNRFD